MYIQKYMVVKRLESNYTKGTNIEMFQTYLYNIFNIIVTSVFYDYKTCTWAQYYKKCSLNSYWHNIHWYLFLGWIIKLVKSELSVTILQNTEFKTEIHGKKYKSGIKSFN